jgi:uncharacterized phage-associated protein
MRPQYQEVKAFQVACLLLSLRGGTMSYMKLLKLMYLIDRTALIKWGRSLTFDSVVSMNNGLVLSNTYDLIVGDSPPNTQSIWRLHISYPNVSKDVTLEDGAIEYDELSDAEEELIRDIFEKYGKMSRWELVDLHHKLPEWSFPNGSAIPHSFREILSRSGEKEISSIEQIDEELMDIALLDSYL